MSARHKPAAAIFQEQQLQKMEDEALAEVELEVAEEAAGPQARNVFMGTAMAAPVAPPPPPAQAARKARRLPLPGGAIKTSEELQLEKEPIQVRITGFWRWKQVVVPPNAYVVHTRLGRKEPVTLGLGLSFRYNPFTDAFLVVPAAMQTIGVVANCISKEKQGINVLAYVQWQISDFSIAYRRLDFSDSRDPLSIVNAQLREQAEAAIKDKIATMSVEEVLTDKAPVIEELTRRLIEVSEGRGGSNTEGLGIKIVTVQIKEAFVSSQRLWEHLQAPYRHEQEKAARISLLEMQELIRVKELENRRLTETSEAETQVEIARITQSKQTEAQELRLTEEAKRFAREQEAARARIQLQEQTVLAEQESEKRLQIERLRIEQEKAIEQARQAAETSRQQKVLDVERQLQETEAEQRLQDRLAEVEQRRFARETAVQYAQHEFALVVQELEQTLERQSLEGRRHLSMVQLEIDEAVHRAKATQMEREAQITRLQQEIRNLTNEQDVMARLVERLPEIAAQMPEVHEMRVWQLGDAESPVAALIKSLLAVLESIKTPSDGASQNTA